MWTICDDNSPQLSHPTVNYPTLLYCIYYNIQSCGQSLITIVHNLRQPGDICNILFGRDIQYCISILYNILFWERYTVLYTIFFFGRDIQYCMYKIFSFGRDRQYCIQHSFFWRDIQYCIQYSFLGERYIQYCFTFLNISSIFFYKTFCCKICYF